MRNINKQLIFLVLFTSFSTNQAHAAPPVDAGSIQRDIEKLNRPNVPPPAIPREQEKVLPAADNSVSVKVSAFQFVGNKLLKQSLLQAEVQNYIGKTLDYNGLTQVTKKISQLYQNNGCWQECICRHKIFKMA